LIVLAICGCSIGVLSFFTLLSIIRTLRAEGMQQFASDDLIGVEGEERMGAADVAMPNVNTALARNIAEKMQARKTPIQLMRNMAEKVQTREIPIPLTRKIAEKVQTREIPIPLKGSEKIAGLNVPRSGVNAALARSIAEKAQRARNISVRGQIAQNARPGDNSERVIPGIMVKTRTLSNLEDAKAIIQRKMKEQEGRTRSRGDIDIADAMIVPNREKVEARLEEETFEGIRMPDEKEGTQDKYDAGASVYFPPSSGKSGMGEAEGGPSSTDELMRRAAIIDVKSLNTEFVELRESLVLLKTKLKDIQEKRKKYH